jgi:serine/threonine protein kinase
VPSFFFILFMFILVSARFCVLRVFKVISALTQLATALRHLHSFGIAHADLKPKNVIRIYNHQLLLDMDNSGVFGTDYFGLKFSSRPSCRPRPWCARRGDRAGAGARLFVSTPGGTGGRVDVASGVGP